MSAITTHVLDAVLGKPAGDIPIDLERYSQNGWEKVSSSATNNDGRCKDLCVEAAAGTYRLIFDTRSYFNAQRRMSIYTEVAIVFLVDGEQSYHMPLLLSDNSYTTYRGS